MPQHPFLKEFYSTRDAASLFGVGKGAEKAKARNKRVSQILQTETLEEKLGILFLKPDVEDEMYVSVRQKSQLFRGRFNVSNSLDRENAIGLAIVKKMKKAIPYGKYEKRLTTYITYDLIEKIEKSGQYEQNSQCSTLGEVKNNYKSWEILKK